jgi:L-ascorbate metabolism protein UlaG (beta-lactamase superfamily)
MPDSGERLSCNELIPWPSTAQRCSVIRPSVRVRLTRLSKRRKFASTSESQKSHKSVCDRSSSKYVFEWHEWKLTHSGPSYLHTSAHWMQGTEVRADLVLGLSLDYAYLLYR